MCLTALAGCGGDGGDDPGSERQRAQSQPRAAGAIAPLELIEELDPDADEPSTIIVERYGLRAVDFEARSSAVPFREAVEDFAAETGAARVEVDGIPGAAGFRISSERADQELLDWHQRYLARGAFLLRYDPNYGYARDAILLLPTQDPWEALAAAGTNGANYDVSNREIGTWLRRLHATHRFTLTGAGFDHVEGTFENPIEDDLQLARRMYAVLSGYRRPGDRHGTRTRPRAQAVTAAVPMVGLTTTSAEERAMTNRDTEQVTEPASPERAAEVATPEGREDDRNRELDQSPVPDPEEKDSGTTDDPQAD